MDNWGGIALTAGRTTCSGANGDAKQRVRHLSKVGRRNSETMSLDLINKSLTQRFEASFAW